MRFTLTLKLSIIVVLAGACMVVYAAPCGSYCGNYGSNISCGGTGTHDCQNKANKTNRCSGQCLTGSGPTSLPERICYVTTTDPDHRCDNKMFDCGPMSVGVCDNYETICFCANTVPAVPPAEYTVKDCTQTP